MVALAFDGDTVFALSTGTRPLANGPRAFASAYTTRGTYRTRLTVPGQYRIFCSLHPAKMVQQITVR